jgi:hypothetical protein
MGAEEHAYMGGALRAALVRDEPVEGAELLALVLDFLTRFVAYPSLDAAIAHTLWIAHTHLMAAWESTPRIAFLSPEPGSGKTRALEVTETLVPNPMQAVNVSPAFMFRRVSQDGGAPTILFDEIDAIFGTKVRDSNEELRSFVNAGHRRGAIFGRCIMVPGKPPRLEELPAYCAMAIAGLGDLPDTILSRSIIIKMRRRSPTETVEPFRQRLHAEAGNALRDRLSVWMSSLQNVGSPWPTLPVSITDRNADIWEGLIAIADAAGGSWPERVRVTAVTLVTDSKGNSGSLGVRLLSDLRTVFGDAEAMHTETILHALCNLDEAPWGDVRGKAITSRVLANLLKRYDVTSKGVRIDAIVKKGYAREDLYDAWQRYLSPLPLLDLGSVTSVTTVTSTEGTADN